MRVCKTPTWSRNYFSAGSLAGLAFGWGPSFTVGPYDPVTQSCIKFNDSGVRRRRRRKLRQRRLVERAPVAVPILSSF